MKLLERCLLWKILLLSFAAICVATYVYCEVGCTLTSKVVLSTSVTVIAKEYTNRPGGIFVNRAVDVFVDRKRIRRLWCSPLPNETGTSGFDVSLWKGKETEYVAIRDADALWILDLHDGTKTHRVFPETQAPELISNYQVIEGTEILPLPTTFANWVEYANRRRTLLQDEPR